MPRPRLLVPYGNAHFQRALSGIADWAKLAQAVLGLYGDRLVMAQDGGPKLYRGLTVSWTCRGIRRGTPDGGWSRAERC